VLDLRRIACIALVLGLAACREDGIPCAAPVLTLDAFVSDGPFDVDALARAAKCQLSPIGALPRPVQVTRVPAVDQVELVSDRGRERVRIQGLSGDDERLPDDLRAALRGPYLTKFAAWLQDDDAQVFETTIYGPRGAASGPSFPDPNGLRLVTLARQSGRGPLEDVRTHAVAHGWAPQAHPFGDRLALDVDWAIASQTGAFARDVPSVSAAREAYGRAAAAVDALAADELQAIGARIQGDIAEWLGWEPRAELSFVPVPLASAHDVLLPFVRADARAQVDRMRMLAGAPHDANEDVEDAEIIWIGTTPEQAVESMLATLNGYSPAGDTVYVFAKSELTRSMLDDVLAHEILHQYQEELQPERLHFPPPMAPLQWGEAHAEYLAARFRVARFERHTRPLGIDYREPMKYFAAAVAATGLEPDRLYLDYVTEQRDGALWEQLVQARIGLQEYLWRAFGTSAFDGLDFRVVAPDSPAPGSPTGSGEEQALVVRISNPTRVPVRAQFHGVWMGAPDTATGAVATWSGAPFNATVPASGRIDVRLATESSSSTTWPSTLIGLFSRTP